MSEFNGLHEFEVDSLEKIVEIIESKPTIFKSGKNAGKPRRIKYSIYDNRYVSLKGTEIDAYKLIKKYNLKFADDLSDEDYSWFCDSMPRDNNSYIFGPKSMYGQFRINFQIKKHFISIKINPSTSFAKNNSFSSRFNREYSKEPFVSLDIETTGLNPIQDDVIQIALYDGKKSFVKLLPLQKSQHNSAFDINHIPDKKLSNAISLTQIDVDDLINTFDLRNKQIAIWAGGNTFDLIFLEIYFLENNLRGLETLTFFNAKKLAESNSEKLRTNNFSKDNVASILGINIDNSHNALTDAKIQFQIIQKLNDGFELSQDCFENDLIGILKGDILVDYENLYYSYCDFLKRKYGSIWFRYDKPHPTRGKEYIDIHHIDEIVVDDIATKTNFANEFGLSDELKDLEKYNKPSRLIYANKVQHFFLHCLIEKCRKGNGGGPHYLFGDLLKMKTIMDDNGSDVILNNILSKNIFNDILVVYRNLIRNKNLSYSDVSDFWKLKINKIDETLVKRIEHFLYENNR